MTIVDASSPLSAHDRAAPSLSAHDRAAPSLSAHDRAAPSLSARDRAAPSLSARDRAAMIRVDQAGEYGAVRIYAGQRAILGDHGPGARVVAHMGEQEARHSAWFDAALARRGVRPTLLLPVWNIAGFALGAVTAAIGPEAAMACTAAVETEIDRHYAEQLEQLGDSDPELSAAIRDFQADELEHKATALEAGAQNAPLYPLLTGAIRLGCRVAIAVSKRI